MCSRSWSVKRLGIPNMLSILRLVLIPVFIFIYFSKMQHSGLVAAAVLVFSGLTDVLDGIIARRFNMTSALGRILDPLADKLTQVTVCVCLFVRYYNNFGFSLSYIALFCILGLLIVKEAVMIGAAANIIRKGKSMRSSKWFGKMATVAFYVAMFIIIAFSPKAGVIDMLLAAVLGFMVFSLIMYIPVFFSIVSGRHNSK